MPLLPGAKVVDRAQGPEGLALLDVPPAGRGGAGRDGGSADMMEKEHTLNDSDDRMPDPLDRARNLHRELKRDDLSVEARCDVAFALAQEMEHVGVYTGGAYNNGQYNRWRWIPAYGVIAYMPRVDDTPYAIRIV